MITDMETFMMDTSDRIWRYTVSKMSNEAHRGKIVDAIDLGNGDWLLGFKECWGKENSDELRFAKIIMYLRLSEIMLGATDE